MQRRLQKFFPKEGPYPVVHRNLYSVHQRVAASFGSGRVFLAGDSAHVNNPLGGLGLNFGIHDAVELSHLLGSVLRGEAAPHVLDQYDRFRRPLNVEYVQQQTIANKKRLEEKDPAARARSNEALRRTAADPAAHRTYLLRASLLESVRKRVRRRVRRVSISSAPHGIRAGRRSFRRPVGPYRSIPDDALTGSTTKKPPKQTACVDLALRLFCLFFRDARLRPRSSSHDGEIRVWH